MQPPRRRRPVYQAIPKQSEQNRTASFEALWILMERDLLAAKHAVNKSRRAVTPSDDWERNDEFVIQFILAGGRSSMKGTRTGLFWRHAGLRAPSHRVQRPQKGTKG